MRKWEAGLLERLRGRICEIMIEIGLDDATLAQEALSEGRLIFLLTEAFAWVNNDSGNTSSIAAKWRLKLPIGRFLHKIWANMRDIRYKETKGLVPADDGDELQLIASYQEGYPFLIRVGPPPGGRRER